MGFEHDGTDGDLRLPAWAPTRWPHGWRMSRGGELQIPEADPYSVTCPRTGWQVPLVATFQVHEPSRIVLRLVPNNATKIYQLVPEEARTDEAWQAAAAGTIVSTGSDYFLCHDPGNGEVRVRIANRAKAFLYCLETRCPRTGWMVPMLPSLVVSTSRAVVARLEPDRQAKRFLIRIDSDVSDAVFSRAKPSGTVATRLSTMSWTATGTLRPFPLFAAMPLYVPDMAIAPTNVIAR